MPGLSLDIRPDNLTPGVIHLVAARFAGHFGNLEPFGWAVTRARAGPRRPGRNSKGIRPLSQPRQNAVGTLDKITLARANRHFADALMPVGHCRGHGT